MSDPLSPAETEFVATIKRYRADPLTFFHEVLDRGHIWAGVEDICSSVIAHQKTAVAGCHNSSKTWTAAGLALWWVSCWQPAKVYITGPKKDQLKDTLWADLTVAVQNARVPLGGELLTMDYNVSADTFIVASTSRKDTSGGATGMQGYKSPRPLLIMDEATAIERPYWESARGIVTLPENRWLAMGNPTNPNCGFRDCWRAGSGWNTINIDALKTPNLQAGKIVHPYLPTPEWVADMKANYGEGSPTWESRVRGRFPTDAIDTLIGITDLETAFDRARTKKDERTYIGVDVARQGDDFSCIAVVRNEELIDMEWFQIADLVKVAGQVKRMAHRHGMTHAHAHQIYVDATGMGWGVIDVLKHDGWYVKAEDFGRLPKDEDHFYDRRTELWFNVRDWLRKDAALSTCKQEFRRYLESDFCGCIVDAARPKGGKTVMKLEQKIDMKKRLGHSPDHGDAIALAVAYRIRSRSFFDTVPVAAQLPEASARVNPSRHRNREEPAGMYSRTEDAGFYGD